MRPLNPPSMRMAAPAPMQSLEAECFCAVCFEPFIRPITLGCGHTFCEEHLGSMASCALCRADSVPPPGECRVNTTLQAIMAKLDAQLGAKRIVDPTDVELGAIVQRGMGGVVSRGTFRGGQVAVKQLNIAAGAVSFTAAQLREINLVRELSHPCILKVIGTCAPPEAYILTPWCENGDLGAMIASSGAPPIALGAKMLSCIASAVSFLHGQNIVHRDLKPSNVMMLCSVDSVSTTEHVCALADFGIARPASDATMTGAVGTPAYTAPEILRAERYGKPADVYGCGMIAYEIFHGAAPYAYLNPMQVMMKAATGETPPINAALPNTVRSVLGACAAKDPTARPKIEELAGALAGVKVEA